MSTENVEYVFCRINLKLVSYQLLYMDLNARKNKISTLDSEYFIFKTEIRRMPKFG